MKESERLEVIKRIQDDINSEEILEAKDIELKNLSQHDAVKRYLKLKSEIAKIKNNQKIFNNNVEKMIILEFGWAFCRRINSSDFSSCKHDIWVYDGTVLYDREKDLFSTSISSDSERDNDFMYNKYVCLECGHVININNVYEFENNHTVLKDKFCVDVEKYRLLYFQLLYEYSVEDAQWMIIDQFYNGLEKDYKVKKKRGNK